jgi:anaerobic selenocysteine-containing dehydrogenase
VELCLSKAKELDVPDLPQFCGLPEETNQDYPLVLTCSKSPYYLHSSYRWLFGLRRKEPNPVAVIHPHTAEEYGIKEGDGVVIETSHGSIEQKARIRDRVLPGVVHASYGWWFPEAGEERLYDWDRSNYNILTSAENPGREFGTPDLKGLACRIAKGQQQNGAERK